MNPFRLFARALARRSAARRAAVRLSATPLDDRAVPAVGAFAALDGDALSVVGDETANTVILRAADGQVTIDGGRFVTASGVVDSIPLGSIGSINVIAAGGDDLVMIDPAIKAPAIVSAGDGNDTVVAGGGATELFGGAGDDALFGGRSDDRLFGQGGNDTLAGGGGRDAAFGGLGTDSVARSVETRGDAAEVRLAVEPTAPAMPAATAAGSVSLGALVQPSAVAATLVGDVLQIQGTSAADALRLVQSNGMYSLADGTPIVTDAGTVSSVAANRVRQVVVLGYDGDDTIDMSAVTSSVRVIGGNGADAITTGRGADFVFGGAGNDVISTGDGGDRVYAGSGDDNVNLGAGDDVAYGGAGSDTMAGGAGRDRTADLATGDSIAADIETQGDATVPTMPRQDRPRTGGMRR